MECPICGFPLREDDVFCENCGNFSLPLKASDRDIPIVPGAQEDGSSLVDAPEELVDGNTESSHRKVAERLYPPPDVELEYSIETAVMSDVPLAEKASSTPDAAAQQPRKKKWSMSPQRARKSLRRMAIITGIVCLLGVLAIGSAIYVYISSASMRVQLSKAQKESSTAQANVTDLETQVSDLSASLASTEAENISLGTQVADLQAQIDSMESSVNQNQYDKDSALRELEDANAQLSDIQAANEDLQTQLSDAQSELESCQAELDQALEDNDALTDENESLTAQVEEMEDKVDFYDSYVVFVNQGVSDRYYHKYACSEFNKNSFVAYSPKLAESNGYSPCPICCGGTELPAPSTGIFGGLFG